MDNNDVNLSSSDDESVSDETDDGREFLQRDARSITHQTGSCAAAEDETSPTTSPLNAKYINQGNPKLGNRMQLFSRTNYFLAIYADGTVRGTPDKDDLHTHLELTNAGHPGHVRIQGTLTRLYVAMNKKGKLYGEANMWKEGTVFVEAFQGHFNTYLSRAHAHQGWYLGLKKSGKVKRGPLTGHRQKAVLFLPVRTKFE